MHRYIPCMPYKHVYTFILQYIYAESMSGISEPQKYRILNRVKCIPLMYSHYLVCTQVSRRGIEFFTESISDGLKRTNARQQKCRMTTEHLTRF